MPCKYSTISNVIHTDFICTFYSVPVPGQNTICVTTDKRRHANIPMLLFSGFLCDLCDLYRMFWLKGYSVC